MDEPESTDEQLLAQFVLGHRSALGELARRYEMPLLGLARGMLGGDRELACDAVQETWMRVIRFAYSFHGRSSLKTWLYRIAINQCRNLQSARPASEVTPAASGMQATSAAPEPSRGAGIAEENHTLARAVQKLEQNKQEIVLLCYHAGMTHEHAAEILEIPLGTLKSRLHAALQELRERLGSEGKR